MKRILFLALLASVSLFSCKKDSDNSPTSTLTVTMDGSTKTFNNSLVGSLITNGGMSGLQILGFAGAAGSSDALYVTALSQTAIAPGIYEDGQGATVAFVSQAGGVTNYTNAISANNPLTITITSITGTNATGTFSGEIFLDGNTSSTKKVLANGVFNVKLQ